MKVLILTCSTGEGHNSVSSAVREAITARGVTCDIADALSFLSEKMSELICRWHARLYRHMPSVWRVSYRLLKQHPSLGEDHNLVAGVLALGAEKLYALVVQGGYDCLLCPHVFSALMVTQLRKTHPELALDASFIATDYTCSPLVEDCVMGRYFVPSPAAAEEFVQAGIPAGQIVPIPGVPVRRAFYGRVDKTEARRRLGLPLTGRLVLAMCGSMGCGHLDELTELLAQRLPENCSLAVVCGTYVHLQKKLERLFAGRPDVAVWGYREDVPLLMDSADLFLTKPGGVSTSEAAVKGLPMVLVDAVSACETPNLRHFCALGVAVTAPDPEALAALCLRLLADGEQLEKMGAALARGGNAAEAIWSHLAEKEKAAR